MKHAWAFTLFLGGAIGAVSVFVAVEGPAATDDAGAGTAAPLAAVGTGSRVDAVAVDADLDDAGLARQLEQAHFDRDWARVSAVEHVLRERRARERAARVAAAAVPAPPATPTLPALVRLDHDYRRAAFLRALATRDNAATRAAARDAPAAEREEALVALLVAAPAKPEDEVVRADAAHLLGQLGRERARKALLDALGDPHGGELGLVAARALARADDPLATDALLGLLRDDLDPARRSLAAEALAESAGLVDGELVPAALAKAAQDDHDTLVRTHALATLARADLGAFPTVRATLVTLATSETEDAIVRQAVVATIRAHHALAQDTPPDLTDLLLQLLDAAAVVPFRGEVVAALGECGGRDALPRLEAALAAAPQDERRPLEAALAQVKRRVQVD